MTSVTDILEQLEFKAQDLNYLTPVLIQKIFSTLTVKEISLLCVTNRKFDIVCKQESLWKDKVLSDYGIEKKYGATWRETAQRMSEINMINLNGKWINGETYRELLGEDIELLFITKTNLLSSFVNNDKDAAVELMLNLSEEEIQYIANEVLGRQFTDDELDEIYHINSREIRVIEAVILVIYDQSVPFLPGTANAFSGSGLTGISVSPKDFILDLINPIMYVMQFSMFSDSDLVKFIQHERRY
uniref:F-box-like protein n=1 Tax=Pithovirus LCPAC406 TaxID=2506599 RepID=A0A481ZGP3_9VIRU|nr:MAG: hypothetical protein LCPAC406_02030 [Pithovirus LCPAC406]